MSLALTGQEPSFKRKVKSFVKGADIAKLYWTEAAFQVANQSLQVHGGIGYTKDLPVERYFRDARSKMIGRGTSEIMRH